MKRILVVEDELDALDMLAVLLEDEGYEVIPAHNGREGLDALKRSRVDLIVTDVMMPFMSGEQMLAEVKKDPNLRDIPIIVMSAGDGVRAARRFHCAYFQKPMVVDDFLRVVKKLVR